MASNPEEASAPTGAIDAMSEPSSMPATGPAMAESPKEHWRHHGSNVEGADEIWLAVIGPDTPALGEIGAESQLYQNQVAKTVAYFLGVEYENKKPVGKVMESFLEK